MNFIIYIPPVKPKGQAQGLYFSLDDVYSVRRCQFSKDEDNYSTSREVKTWHILAQVIASDFLRLLATSPTWHT